MSEADQHAIAEPMQTERRLRVRHITRRHRVVYTDHTEWIVLEESPSFYIVYREGDGIGVKRKGDYELV